MENERLEVVLRERLEGQHRLGVLDAVELGELAGHDGVDARRVAHAQDGDEVPLTGDGVGLGDAFDLGELTAEVGQRLALGLDEDDGVGHLSSCVSPGLSTYTCEKPAFSTSCLNASASVATSGNVS